MEGRWLCALVDAWLIGQQMPTLPFHLSACLVPCPTHRNPLRLHVMYYTCAHPLHEGRSWGCSHVSKGAILAGDGGACRMVWAWGCSSEPDCPESILLLRPFLPFSCTRAPRFLPRCCCTGAPSSADISYSNSLRQQNKCTDTQAAKAGS